MSLFNYGLFDFGFLFTPMYHVYDIWPRRGSKKGDYAAKANNVKRMAIQRNYTRPRVKLVKRKK